MYSSSDVLVVLPPSSFSRELDQFVLQCTEALIMWILPLAQQYGT